ncbi:MAG: tetrahydromethanopterin S-methyltransferase subunit H, partial [Candidatus Bathyarchaeia archaeon]
QDEQKGLFDRAQAEELIRIQEELSDTTGNPCMLDVEGATAQALERYIDFSAGVTDIPLMIGGPTPEVREAGLRFIKEGGLVDRVVYNSLMPGCGAEEIEKIKDGGVESAVLLAYNVTDLTPNGRVDALSGLLELTKEKGLDKPLLDTFVMDVPSLGIAFRALMDVKSTLGLPTGCGPHNAVGLWKGLRKKMGMKSISPIVASVNALAASAGADWILYGPIEGARVVFPAVAMADAAYAFPSIQSGFKLSRSHPLFKIA